MAEIIIKAQTRDEFGKGAARRMRRDKMIPAVLYGHGTDPVHIALPAHATAMALRTANALLDIDIEGGKGQLALPKQIQRDPVRGTIEHVDLIIVRRGEKVTVEVPLTVVGEIRGSGVIIQDQNTIMLEVEATKIPASIEINVDGMEVGVTILAQDLNLPEGAVFPGDPEDLILSIQAPQAKDMGESTAEEGEGSQEAEEATEE
ncbi:MAG: 50S ribosomal protein L25/general stress protein Ctc [Propionibacteriaceae bacterium]|jgi:large subunit ribosomal protein L25|nr:50S ribosomal protein L25/general stress protein Ctc [Propionibacteriaceae bacterium]